MSAVQGNRSHDATDRGAPIKTGGKAVGNTVPPAVANGDRVDAWYDVQGALVTDPRAAEWVESVSAISSAAATVSHASESGKTHYVTGFIASYRSNLAQARLVDIYDGATKTFGVYAGTNPMPVIFPRPVRLTQSSAATVVAAAAAAASGELHLSVFGYTKDD